jgi:hypothetical protein
MERESIIMQMDASFKENGRRTREVNVEYTIILMEINMLEI